MSVGLSCAREITLFVTYLSPLQLKACAANIGFWTGFSKIHRLKERYLDRRRAGGCWASSDSEVYLFYPSIMLLGVLIFFQKTGLTFYANCL